MNPKLRQKAREAEQVGLVGRYVIFFGIIIVGIVIHGWLNEDVMEKRTQEDAFQRNVHRKALPGPRPKDKPLGERAVSIVRSYLSAFTRMFEGDSYKSEWLRQIEEFENAPLLEGTIEFSTVHQDRLNRTVREVGYGITDAEIYEAKRLGLLPKDAALPSKMTKDEAHRWFLDITIPTYEKCVEEVVKVPLTCEQKFALISFCHNLGKGNLARLVNRSGRLRDSNYSSIAPCILRYTYAAGNKDVAGLVKRRAWESDLFESGTNDHSVEQVASR